MERHACIFFAHVCTVYSVCVFVCVCLCTSITHRITSPNPNMPLASAAALSAAALSAAAHAAIHRAASPETRGLGPPPGGHPGAGRSSVRLCRAASAAWQWVQLQLVSTHPFDAKRRDMIRYEIR